MTKAAKIIENYQRAYAKTNGGETISVERRGSRYFVSGCSGRSLSEMQRYTEMLEQRVRDETGLEYRDGSYWTTAEA